jgi:phosphopantothenoylcysteine decarboxylase/phosphopantothenate--cysteine ligase
MKEAMLKLYPESDIVLMAAAVADYRPVEISKQKLKKNQISSLGLEPTEDILSIMGEQKGSRILVGFAAETEDMIEGAKGKLTRKNLDIIVANDVSRGVFGADSASVCILTHSGESEEIKDQSKISIAHRILDTLQKHLAAVGCKPG